ncbi:ATPase, T2SS/T4P/T4SS family [Tepidibacillus marianensis]|uniref:GspE/PulE family protein n=1 Tax=Tepidibacillus marianensis TaxID=3131995 RepID=UPI0030D5791F
MPTKKVKKRVGDLLVETGMITQAQLEVALTEQKTSKKKLGDILIAKGYVTEQQMIEVLEFQLGIPHVSLYKYQIDRSIIQIIPEKLAMNYQVIPFRKNGNKLMVAMADPLDYYAIEDMRMTTGFQIEPAIATREELTRAIDRYYGIQETLNEIMQNLPKEEDMNEQLQSEDAPVSRMVNQIIQNAVKQRSSDIHFDPQDSEFRVRFRIDGQIRTEQVLPKHMQGIITARLKIMAQLNIAEKRLPQDGRIQMEVDYRAIDVRVATLPTVHGEKIVLRILDLSQAIKQIEQLGFIKENAAKFRQMINKSYGIVLITGPTGSGKTSTLYAALNELNKEDVNVITVEDPVEYRLTGINQVQVNDKTGLTFARGLRSILRQDPNIIMVGEIRDLETAEIAVRAALTGHLVLSTIHTNDAVSTVTRLIDMGIEPFLISSALTGVIGQRLVRRICTDCDVPYEPSVEEKKILEQSQIQLPKLMKGRGCAKCNRTGYSGRIAIHELLVLDDHLKQMVVEKQPDSVYRNYLRQKGFVTMFEDGLEKVKQGLTSISEVVRATSND